MNWFLFFTSVWAITYVCVDADITEPIRKRLLYKGKYRNIVRSNLLFRFFDCYFCFGTWIALGLYHLFFPWNHYAPFVVLAGGAVSRFLNAALLFLERGSSD